MESFWNIVDGIKVWRYSMLGIDASMYVMIQGSEALVVDPSKNQDAVTFLKLNEIDHVLILLTHEHFDHISGVNMLREQFGCHVICSEEAANAITDPNKNMAKFWEVTLMDKSSQQQLEGMALKDENYSCTADEIFEEMVELQWNGHLLRMLTAPGHSKGSALYFLDNLLFTGDSLVNGVGVICRLPGGNWNVYCEKTRPIIQGLSDNTMIFPGHGSPDVLANLRKYLVKFGTAFEEAEK